MKISNEQIIKNLNIVYDEYLDYCKNFSRVEKVPIHPSMGIFTLLSDTILRLAPEDSSYYEYACNVCDAINDDYSNIKQQIIFLGGITESLRMAYKNDLFINIDERIRAETFSDFLEMAEHLINEYEAGKNPAAVLIGSVLEQHLRKLCSNNNINIYKDNKTDFRNVEDLNQDLYITGKLYNKTVMQMVKALFAIRNYAAHGEYDQITKQQVENMLRETRSVIGTYPA